MSDSNNNRKTAARQANQGQPSHYEQARAYLSGGMQKSAVKYGEISQASNPHTLKNAAAQTGQAAWAGRKDYAKSAYHAGMGFMEGVSKQNPNSGQQLNNMKINQSIAQGRYQQDKVNSANRERQNSAYVPKANQQNKTQSASNKGIESARSQAAKAKSSASSNKAQPSHNKGIETARQKATAKPSETSTGKSANKGIASYQSKTSGQSAGSSKSGASSTAKGSSSSSTAKSSGSSGGGQSSSSGQKR